jgi:hypothetical protein
MASYNPVMADFMAEAVRKNKIFAALLEEFIEGKNDLSGMTFKHIKTYLETGEDTGRLGVALMDSGFTPEEMKTFRDDGKSAKEVVQIWLDRT